jgi:hypothetical protein
MVIGVEKRPFKYHLVKDRTQAKHITDGRKYGFLVVTDTQNLWSYIARCSTSDKNVGLKIGLGGKTKVHNFYVKAILRNENVVRLEIPVKNSLFVHLL